MALFELEFRAADVFGDGGVVGGGLLDGFVFADGGFPVAGLAESAGLGFAGFGVRRIELEGAGAVRNGGFVVF